MFLELFPARLGYSFDIILDVVYRIQPLSQQRKRIVTVYIHGVTPCLLCHTDDFERIARISLDLGVAPIAVDHMLLWMLL
mmetsp:Transcript_27889/g.59682  ORF Transcript_27889/g.59682 Transcript_27889/m.59682 type:complete len:80 (+) Transcript_27889:435-674(+)